jgi:hypothetical protein
MSLVSNAEGQVAVREHERRMVISGRIRRNLSPKPNAVLVQHNEKKAHRGKLIVEAGGIYAVFYDGKHVNFREIRRLAALLASRRAFYVTGSCRLRLVSLSRLHCAT